MHSIRNTRKMQSGFTLIELIVVIVIVGILAAVAIPKFTDTQTAARQSVLDSTVGALKSSWATVYASKKGVAPTAQEVAAAMAEPTCTMIAGTNTANCGNVMKADGTALAVFQLGAAGGTPATAVPDTTSISGI